MSVHRILRVPAGQILIGDVVLTYPTSHMDRILTQTGMGYPERERVIEYQRDASDGTIYIKTKNVAQYCQPYDIINLDCLLTFGKNNGEMEK